MRVRTGLVPLGLSLSAGAASPLKYSERDQDRFDADVREPTLSLVGICDDLYFLRVVDG